VDPKYPPATVDVESERARIRSCTPRS